MTIPFQRTKQPNPLVPNAFSKLATCQKGVLTTSSKDSRWRTIISALPSSCCLSDTGKFHRLCLRFPMCHIGDQVRYSNSPREERGDANTLLLAVFIVQYLSQISNSKSKAHGPAHSIFWVFKSSGGI